MKNKVVIITGGSSGIGKALADAFGMAGAKIVITGRRIEALEKTQKELEIKGIEVLSIQADASKIEDNERMAQTTIRHFGRIDILINNAGISMRALFEDLELNVIKKVMDINFYGALYATKACISEIKRNKGSVVGISSIAGYRGLPGRVGYSASKFALQGFLEALRTEMLHDGVHILTACPGFTASNIRNTALAADGSQQGESPRDEQKMMTAEVCAQHILRAVRKRKKILILTRQGKLTVFLNKWFPSFMDTMVYNHMAKEKDSPFKK